MLAWRTATAVRFERGTCCLCISESQGFTLRQPISGAWRRAGAAGGFQPLWFSRVEGGRSGFRPQCGIVPGSELTRI